MSKSTSTLEILLKLRDEASTGLKEVGSSLKKTGMDFESAVGPSKAFAVGLAAVGAAAGVAGAYMIGQAREAAKAQNQLNAVLESTKGVAGVTAQAANELATQMQRLTNYDDEAVLGAENILLTFTKIGKDVFPTATETVLDMSAALGQDLQSSAVQLGKALQDPIEGVSALRRVGVNFSQDQQDVIKNLVETGRAAEAQKLILAELATEFGGSAKAVADPIIQMKNSLNDAAEAVGVQLLPAVNKLAGVVTHFASEVLPVWIENAGKLVNFLKEHPAVLYAVTGAIVGALLPAIVSLGVTLVTVTIPAFIAAAVALAPFLIGGALIGGLIAGIVWLVQNWDLVKLKAAEVWGAIAATITAAFAAIGNGMKEGVNLMIGLAEGWANSWVTAANTIIGALNKIKFSIPDWVPGVGGKSFSINIPTVPEINLPRLATGGIVNRATIAMIGEAGPEAVIPLNKLGSFSGGGNIVVNITGNVYSSREAAIDMANEIARVLRYQVRI